MKPTKPIFKWKPFDYTEPGHLQKVFARVRREQAAEQKAASEAALECIMKVRPMERKVRG